MAVYTVVFSFRGTPFTHQVSAKKIDDVLPLWATKVTLPQHKVPSVSLEEAVKDVSLFQLKGPDGQLMSNVWSVFLGLGEENGVLTIILTQQDSVRLAENYVLE